MRGRFRTAVSVALLALAALAGAAAPVHGQDDPAARAAGLERIVAGDPADVDARLELAGIYATLGRTDDAVAQYEAVLNLVSEESEKGREASRRMRYLIATRHAERQELDDAAEMFGELAAEYPDNVLIQYSFGVAELLRGHLDEAQIAFEHVIELDPRYLNAYVNLATVHERRGEFRNTVELLERVIEIAPDSQAAVRAGTRLDIIEGGLLRDLGNLRGAAEAFERALESDPQNRAALRMLAEVHRRAGDRAAEAAVLERTVAAYPDDLGSRLDLAEALLAEGRHEESFDQLEAVAAQEPQGALAARQRALFERLRNTEEGRRRAEERTRAELERLQARVEENPDDAHAWRELAVFAYRVGEQDEALRAFEAARAIDPADLRTRYALAALYDTMGRFADASMEFSSALEHETDEDMIGKVTKTLRTVDAKLLYVEGRYPEAIAAFEALLANNPDDQLAHFYLGLIYSQEEEPLRAVDAYQEVIRIIPSHVGARLNLASNYERLNREEDAIAEYEKILQANPTGEVAETARRALESARRRIRGLSTNVSYVMAYDDNTNLSAASEVDDFRSDLSLNLSYQYKMRNGLRWRLAFAPTYATYHRGQFDYLNTNATLSLGFMRGRYNLVGGIMRRTSEGLVTESRIGRMNTVFAEGFTRIRLPRLLSPWSGEFVSSNVTASVSFSDFEGTSNPFFSARTGSLNLSIAQPLGTASSVRGGYQFVINDNKELVGSDYAYTSHGLSAGLDHRLSWGSVNASYGLTLLDYTNPDSFSRFTRTRENVRHSLSAGASWRFRPGMRLFTTVAWTRNRSNLPVGFVLSSEDIVEGLQSSSLSDYDRLVVSTGLSVSF